jgi:hypothetical protein
MNKMALVTTILISVSGNNFAQAPDTLWSKIYGITLDIDQGKCVRQTLDGGLIITGSCVPNGMVSHIDLLLLKADASGNIIWTKTYGRNFIEQGLAVEQTTDGGYIIGGRALFITGHLPTNDNQSEVWMLKTDGNGDTLWTRTYGGSGHDYCTSIQQTQDSGYIMVGTMNSKYAYPPSCFLDCSDYYSSRAWLIKTNADGDTLWTKTFNAGSYGNGVEQTSDGGYIVVGTLLSGNQMDILLVKTNSMGDTVWTKIIGGSDALEFGRGVRQVPDGYVITGHCGPVPPGTIDALLMRTNLSGEVLWEKTYGGEFSDSGSSVALAPDGGFFIAGIANAKWYIHQGDMWAFRTDPAGNLLWERVYNIALNDFAWSGIQATDGGYVMTGTMGYGFGGDLWLAKIGQKPTGIKDNPAAATAYVLWQNYPNPFNPSTRISYALANADFVVLKIYDVVGRTTQTLVSEFQKAGTYAVDFDARELASGVYLYQLQVGNDFAEIKKMLFMR